MKTFYCVTSYFFDNGHVKATLSRVRAPKKPKNTSLDLLHCDIYDDYFSTYEKAAKHRQDCLKA